jgi:hypothetical protein
VTAERWLLLRRSGGVTQLWQYACAALGYKYWHPVCNERGGLQFKCFDAAQLMHELLLCRYMLAVWTCGVVQTIIYCDFFYYYFKVRQHSLFTDVLGWPFTLRVP